MKKSNKKNIFNYPRKSFSINPLLNKDGSYLKKNAKILKYNSTVYLPIVSSRDDLAHYVKSLFGESLYYKFFYNYIFTKKFIFQNAYVGGDKTTITPDIKSVVTEVMENLPKLRTKATFKYIDKKNIIADFSEQFNIILPKNNVYLTKQTIFDISERILIELISAFGIDNGAPELYPYLTRYKSSYEKIPLNMMHTDIIIDFKVESTNVEIPNKYLKLTKKLTRSIKTNNRDLYTASLVRFISLLYQNDFDNIEDEKLKTLCELYSEKNISFILRNNNFYFIIDFNELRKAKIDYNNFYQKFKTKLKLLISNNSGAVQTKDIVAELDEIEEENASKRIEKNVNINGSKKKITIVPDKKIIDKNIDEVKTVEEELDMPLDEERMAKDTANLIKSHLLKKSLKRKEDTDISAVLKEIKDLALKTDINKDIDNLTKNVVATNIEEPDFDIEEEKDEIEEEEIEETHNDDISDMLEDENDDSDFSLLEDDGTIENRELTEEERKKILKDLEKMQRPKKTPAQLRRIAEAEKKYKSIKLDDRTLEEILEDAKAANIDTTTVKAKNVRDKSMLKSALLDFDKSYINNSLVKQLVDVFKCLSEDNKSIPMYILDFKFEDNSDNFNNMYTLTVKIEDINQKRHNIKVDVPMPDEDMFLFLGGNKKHLTKQLLPLPVTKTKNDFVALSSNKNKVFLFRQGTVLNRRVVVLKKIFEKHIDVNKREKEFIIYRGDNSKTNNEYLSTVEYDDLAKIYHKVILGKKTERVVYFFNQNEIRKEIKSKSFEYEFKTNILPIGLDYKNRSVIDINMNKSKNSVVDIILHTVDEKNLVENLEKVVNSIKTPSRRIYSRMNLLSKQVPIIAFLGAMYGLKNVLTVNQTNYTFSPQRIRGDNRLTIKFKDGFLYYDEYPVNNSLLLNGLTEMITEDYLFEDFDTVVPYVDYTFKAFKSRNIVKGWTSFKEFFLDPITKGILKMSNMPTDMLELFLFANDLLGDNHKSHISSMSNMRLRGYEIIPVILYLGLSREYARFKQKTAGARATLSLPQNEIISGLNKSMLLSNYDTLNPVNELKMISACTYKGTGGTNLSHAFDMERRAFHPDALGIVALATTPSAMAGVGNTLTMDPRIVNTYGMLDPIQEKDKKNLTFAEMSSPEESAIAFMMKYDHPNRIGFAAGQTKHILNTEHADTPLVNTGLDKIMIHRCGNVFAGKTPKDGKVTVIDEEQGVLVVTHKDNSTTAFPIGSSISRNSNFFVKNSILPNVKLNQTVKANDIVTYSKEFFKKVGGQLVMTQGTMARVAIAEGYYTEEDGSLLSQTLSEKMSTIVIKRKQISFSTKSNIITYKTIGDHVKVGDSMMLFEDQIEEGNRNEILDVLEEADEDTLESLLYHAPKSNVTGSILDMKMYWTVPVEEMSPSCAKMVKLYISRIKKIIKLEEGENPKKKSRKRGWIEQSVPDRGRIKGATIPDDGGILIEYYIEHKHEQNAGDKSSVHSALKTITCQVIPKGLEPYSESGKIDMVSGFISITNRMINSIYHVGTVGKILMDFGKMVSDEYLGNK